MWMGQGSPHLTMGIALNSRVQSILKSWATYLGTIKEPERRGSAWGIIKLTIYEFLMPHIDGKDQIEAADTLALEYGLTKDAKWLKKKQQKRY